MKTLILTLILMLGLTQISFAQGNGGRHGDGAGLSGGDGQAHSMRSDRRGKKGGERFKNKGDEAPIQQIIKFMKNEKIGTEAKNELAKEYKKLHEESFNLRLAHEEKIYKLRKENMEQMHTERLKEIKKNQSILSSLDITSIEELKKHQDQMKEKRQSRIEKRNEMEKQKQEMAKLREEFRNKLRELNQNFRTKMKDIAAKYRK